MPGDDPALVARVGAFLAGAALGAATIVGGMLLLYVEDGFLPTFGFLAALVLLAHAAGFWVGRPHRPSRGDVRIRGGLAPGWAGAIAAFAIAAVFAQLWMALPALREVMAGRALGVVIFLAEPAYAAGALLAALDGRTRGRSGSQRPTGAAAPALAGSALGVLLTAVVLMPGMMPATLYWTGTAALILAGLWEGRAIRASGPLPDAHGGVGMNGKRVIITGVGDPGQLGYSLAEAFLDAGTRLVITDVRPRVDELAAELRGKGEVYSVRADLTSPEEAGRVAAVAAERYGGLDAVVNAAGGLTVIKPLAETEVDEWEREWRRNASTAFTMSRAALHLLRESRGAIVNFTAPAGLRAAASLGAYSAAKAAVIAITRSLALEERNNGIRVNAIAPGLIDTVQNRREISDPGQRWVRREEIASVVLFLVDDAASGVSGEVIHVLGDALE